MKKILSVFLAVAMIFCSVSIISYAKDDSKLPVIFVDGIMSSGIICTDTGESAFPPSAEVISGAVAGALPSIVSALGTNDFSRLGKPIANALVNIFDSVSCDENGNPVHDTCSDYTVPASEEINAGDIALSQLNFDAEEVVWFSYDWRMETSKAASELYDCINAVMDSTGAEKVNLVGFSMGAAVVTTYLYEYNYEFVNDVVMLAGAYNGATVCGEPFTAQIKFDEKGLIAFLKTMLADDITAVLVNTLMSGLYQSGVLSGVMDIAAKISDAVMSELTEYGLKQTFARMPGVWALVPYNMYDDAKAMLTGDNVSDEFIAKIDYYHNNIQGNTKAILDGVTANGGHLAIISKYGSTITPVCVSQMNIGDTVLDVVTTSFGATCADAASRLADDYVQAVDCGHNHISADRMIDASTCAYPESTWFIKGLTHSEHNDAQWKLIEYIFASKTQPTVWSSPEFSQFLLIKGDTITPLTEENAADNYGAIELKGFFRIIIDAIVSVIKLLMSYIPI